MDSTIIGACIGGATTIIGALIASGIIKRPPKLDDKTDQPEETEPNGGQGTTQLLPQQVFHAEGRGGANATAMWRNGRFIVFQGSVVRADTTESCPESALRQRQQLIEEGVLTTSNGKLTFTRDQEFGSPSAASSVVLGRSSNGNIDWVNESGQQLGNVLRQ